MDFLSETTQAEMRVKYWICWKKKMKKLRIVYTTKLPFNNDKNKDIFKLKKKKALTEFAMNY